MGESYNGLYNALKCMKERFFKNLMGLTSPELQFIEDRDSVEEQEPTKIFYYIERPVVNENHLEKYLVSH